jgi:hypothetical protein
MHSVDNPYVEAAVTMVARRAKTSVAALQAGGRRPAAPASRTARTVVISRTLCR